MTGILIADDRPEVHAILGPRLESKSFSVNAATNGCQVLKIAARCDIDLILMDMNMPEMDGCEAAASLKADEATHAIPIVMFTTHPLAGDRKRAADSGCDGFLEKPTDFDALLTLISRLLHHEDAVQSRY